MRANLSSETYRFDCAAKGWAVARYSKPGVSDTRINFNEYRRTSYTRLCQQLQQIWTNLPLADELFSLGVRERSMLELCR